MTSGWTSLSGSCRYACLLVILLLLGAALQTGSFSAEEDNSEPISEPTPSPTAGPEAVPEQPSEPTPSPTVAPEAVPDQPAEPAPSAGPLAPEEHTALPQIPDASVHPTPAPPDDPCLPPLFRNWGEFSLDARNRVGDDFARIRIVIDRAHFMLDVEGIRRDGSIEGIYRTHVALGGPHSPTPAGQFVINHVYCYPDVAYFDRSLGEISGLYKGFFAPLLICDERGHCKRYHELGLHGYDAAAYPRPVTQTTYGPASAGCIRLPDPCKMKTLLIRLVGIGPLKKDNRGCYHWLDRPVEVLIEGEYPWMADDQSLDTILSQGLKKVQTGLEYLLGIVAP